MVLCRSTHGYLWQFEVYTGRSDSGQDGLGKRVVLGLSEQLQGLRYHLYFYNFFSSVSLLTTLLQNGLYACGTARHTYKQFPAALKMKGKSIAQMAQHGLINRTFIHTHMYMYVHVYMCVCTCMYMFVCMYMYKCMSH